MDRYRVHLDNGSSVVTYAESLMHAELKVWLRGKKVSHGEPETIQAQIDRFEGVATKENKDARAR